jgi:hypothetical protein
VPRRTALAWLLAPLSLALILLAGAPLTGQDKGKNKGKDKKAKPAPPSAYYPLKVGTVWEYRVGKQKLTVRVLREETVEKNPVAVLEATLDGKAVTERVGVRKDGVYRYSGEGVDYHPPLCILKLPPKSGETWAVKARGDGLEVAGTFTAGEEEVTVPAGMYEAVTASCPELRLDEVKMAVTYWFVPGIGLVKQRVRVGGRDVVLELAKYTPAK